MAVVRDTVEEFWGSSTVTECYHAGMADTVPCFLGRLRDYLRATGSFQLSSSARTALAALLRATGQGVPGKVLISSFNCEVVAQAVLDAGFSVDTFDLVAPNGGVDWESVGDRITDSHVAVVIPHLFGVPTDFRPVIDAARRRSTLLVEDCSMTLGGLIGDRHAGTLGDAAIFSFNYDKPISLGGGGALLVNTPGICPGALPINLPTDQDQELRELTRFREYLRWRRDGIPQSRIGRLFRRFLCSHDECCPWPVGMGPLRASLGIWAIDRYEAVRDVRNRNADDIVRGLSPPQVWHVDRDVTPAYLKQRILTSSQRSARQLSRSLQRRGLRVGRFNWPHTIEDFLGREPPPSSREAARRGLDVPIHQNMQRDELDDIRKTLSTHERHSSQVQERR